MKRLKAPNPEWFTNVYNRAEAKAGSRAELARVLGAPDSTLQGWTNPIKPVTPKIDHIHKLFEYIGGDIWRAFPEAKYRTPDDQVPVVMESAEPTSMTVRGSLNDAILTLLPKQGINKLGDKVELRLVLSGQCSVEVGDK